MDWIVTNNRFIGFFDIMGFSNLVYTNTHKTVLKKLEKLSSYVKGLDNSEFGQEGDITILKTAIFSDSLIFITDNDSVDAGIHLLLICAKVYELCCKLGIPIKGSFSHGEFTADFEKSLFFGKPLIEAYQLEEELHLYSAVLHHSFEKKLINEEYSNAELSNNIRLIKYKTPLKGGKSWHYHLNWIFYSELIKDKKLNRKPIDLWIQNFYKTVSGKTRQYVDNTEEFTNRLMEYNEASLLE